MGTPSPSYVLTLLPERKVLTIQGEYEKEALTKRLGGLMTGGDFVSVFASLISSFPRSGVLVKCHEIFGSIFFGGIENHTKMLKDAVLNYRVGNIHSWPLSC